jgi:two-component system response regulator AtoC
MTEGSQITDEWLPRNQPASEAPNSVAGGLDELPPAGAPAAAAVTLPIGTSLAEAERALILATLAHHNQQRERTAAVLGISLKTLYNRLKDYAAEQDSGS